MGAKPLSKQECLLAIFPTRLFTGAKDTQRIALGQTLENLPQRFLEVYSSPFNNLSGSFEQEFQPSPRVAQFQPKKASRDCTTRGDGFNSSPKTSYLGRHQCKTRFKARVSRDRGLRLNYNRSTYICLGMQPSYDLG